VVNVAGTPLNATAFVSGIYTNFYQTPVGGASVSDYGATGNGVIDDSAAFKAALAASDKVLVPSGTYLLASQLVIGSNKSLIGTSSASTIKPTVPYGLLIQGSNIVIQGIHFLGTLSSQQQYQQDGTFTTSMFTGATLVDSSGDAVPSSQASFSILDTSNISVTVSGPAGSQGGPYYLTGTIAGLNPLARYYLHSSGNFIGGTGAMLPTFLLNGTTGYTPGSSSETPYFTGANSLAIQLAAARTTIDGASLVATFAISNLSLFHAVNELASIDTATDENNCYIFIQASNNVFFLNNDFYRFDSAVLKASGTTNLNFVGNTVRQSFGGVTSQDGLDNFFIDNSIDNRMMDDAGKMLNHSIIRSHGFALSFDSSATFQEGNDQIVANQIVGPSWAIEAADSIMAPNVSFNTIIAGGVGISLANRYGTIAGNAITLDGISRAGIEIPTDGINASHDVTITSNSIDMSLSSLYNIGLSATNGSSPLTDLYNFKVSSNKIIAPIGLQFINVQPDSEMNISVTYNQVANLGLPLFIRPSSGSDFIISTDSAVSGNIFTCKVPIEFWGINTAISVAGCP
jgi:hypothetical protein